VLLLVLVLVLMLSRVANGGSRCWSGLWVLLLLLVLMCMLSHVANGGRCWSGLWVLLLVLVLVLVFRRVLNRVAHPVSPRNAVQGEETRWMLPAPAIVLVQITHSIICHHTLSMLQTAAG